MNESRYVEDSVYPVKKQQGRKFLVESKEYKKLYQKSVEENEVFWAEQARSLDWTKPFKKIKDVSLDKTDLHIKVDRSGRLS